jgi:hypothetical protein
MYQMYDAEEFSNPNITAVGLQKILSTSAAIGAASMLASTQPQPAVGLPAKAQPAVGLPAKAQPAVGLPAKAQPAVGLPITERPKSRFPYL